MPRTAHQDMLKKYQNWCSSSTKLEANKVIRYKIKITADNPRAMVQSISLASPIVRDENGVLSNGLGTAKFDTDGSGAVSGEV